MMRFILLFCFLPMLLVLNGCGGNGDEEVESGVICNFRNQEFPFPGGTTCRGLSVTSSDLLNSDDHWYCVSRDDGSIEKYEFFSDGNARVETNFSGIGERRTTFSWTLDQAQCGLWFSGGLLAQCGNRIQFQINAVDENSLELEAEDFENRGLTLVEDCVRRTGRL